MHVSPRGTRAWEGRQAAAPTQPTFPLWIAAQPDCRGVISPVGSSLPTGEPPAPPPGSCTAQPRGQVPKYSPCGLRVLGKSTDLFSTARIWDLIYVCVSELCSCCWPLHSGWVHAFHDSSLPVCVACWIESSAAWCVGTRGAQDHHHTSGCLIICSRKTYKNKHVKLLNTEYRASLLSFALCHVEVFCYKWITVNSSNFISILHHCRAIVSAREELCSSLRENIIPCKVNLLSINSDSNITLFSI